MKVRRLSSNGRVTIPAGVRSMIGLKSGDLVAFDVHHGVVTLRRVDPLDTAFHAALSHTMTEWASPADEAAFRNL